MADILLQFKTALDHAFAARDPFAALITAAAGLVIGGILSTIIFRLPIALLRHARHDDLAPDHTPVWVRQTPGDVAAPRPFCMQCGHGIPWRHTIPILSYLLLQGRCLACGGRISLRYPVIEALACAASLVAFFRFGGDPRMVAAMVLGFALICVAFIDYGELIIPDVVVLPVLWLGLLCNVFDLFTTPRDAVLGAIAGYLSLWSIHWIYRTATGKEGLGYGDFKLLAMLGAWLGAAAIPFVLLLAFGAGSVFGIALMIAGRARPATEIPFGPFLAGAGWITLYWQPTLTSVYWNWMLFSG